jgi:carboxyl-terminal processing protease
MKNIIKVLYVFYIFVLISCHPQKIYINDALDKIETFSMKKEQIDWSDFRSKVLKRGENDKTLEDAHITIMYALSQLNDGHSFFISSKALKKEFSDTTMEKITPIVSEYNNEIGYIKIPGFFGNEKLEKAFAGRIQDLIKDLDKQKITGWIIDLRDNRGGNMWPMLLGVGPILGDGTAGYFVNSQNNFEKWGYSKGNVFLDTLIILHTDSIYQLKNKNKKIAILINDNTASAAEAIAIAFIGLPKARFFGKATHGLTSANSTFILSDSSMIALMTAVYADRTKKLYGKQILPDEIVKEGDAKDLAIKWIHWTMLK